MSVVKSLYRDLGQFQIAIENWTIADHGVTLLWGPSGSGKSTVLNALLGFDPLARVCWEFDGVDLGQMPAHQRGLGAVLQNPALFPHMTAEENIQFPVIDRPVSQWQRDFEDLVQVTGLEACLQTPAALLSGGEAQRVALARALIYRPRMLLLDEPFSALDTQLRQDMRRLLRRICVQRSCPVLLVTHDEADRAELADHLVEIAQGKLVLAEDKISL